LSAWIKSLGWPEVAANLLIVALAVLLAVAIYSKP
jgi:hypothetical protein